MRKRNTTIDDVVTAIPLVRYRFSYRPVEPVQLPEYAGSMWRGAFGRGLKQAVCLLPGQPCEGCPFRAACLYPLFFGADVLREIPRFASPPRPFVLEPGPQHGMLAAGTRVQLSLVLVGGAMAVLPQVLQGLSRAGWYGLGLPRRRLELVEMEQQDAVRLDRWQPILQEGGQLQPLLVPPLAIPAVPPRLRLELMTPLRLKRQQHLLTPRTFVLQDLVDSLLRRMQVIEQFYGAADTTAGPVVRPVEAITSERQRELYWYDWQRWSNRQRTWMKLGGMLGYLDLEGRSLAPVWPQLWLGQWLHVGSAASFGLGQYRLVF